MNKKSILLVGAGQLGSRHLQALSRITQHELIIDVVDPRLDSLNRAKERWGQVSNPEVPHSVKFTTSLDDLSQSKYDFVINASSAAGRLNILKKLIGYTADDSGILLEKLLFTNHEDYQVAKDLLRKNRRNVWVNCPMRQMSFYRDLKNNLTPDEPISYRVSGSQYGLVTNAIHYIDHLCYLTGSNDFALDLSGLDKNPIESKRKGYYEFTGILKAFFSNGSVAILSCYPTGSLPVIVEIESPQCRYISHESLGVVDSFVATSEWKRKQIDWRVPYQSELTAELVNDFLCGNEMKLTPLEESIEIHQNLLNPLKKHLDSSKNNFEFECDYPFT